MRTKLAHIVRLSACVAFLFPAFAQAIPAPHVELRRVPDGGIQPEAAVDRDGTVHLVFFKGDPAAGDLFYVHSTDGANFSNPIQVNSVSGSAIAIGNIRGPRIAVGTKGHVYVVWNGSAKMGDPAQGQSPMLFSRLNQNGTAFEPERNLIHTGYGIDGGGGIAADQQGRVYVFWHALRPHTNGEESRRVWMAESLDDGKTFLPERIAWDQPTGACGCCSLNAYADPNGKIFVLFRAAQETVHRDMYLLESSDHGASFRGSDISKWQVGYCVMSSEAFASGPAGTFGAWETAKQVHFGAIKGAGAKAGAVIEEQAISPKGANQKYPALAVNRDGFLLVAWTEGMGWKRGGSVHYQLVNGKTEHLGERAGEEGTAAGVPAWSLVAAYARPDGSFVVLY